MNVNCLGVMENNNKRDEQADDDERREPGTPQQQLEDETGETNSADDETKMEVEGEMTPRSMAKANKMLDEGDTPKKDASVDTSKLRNESIGIQSLTNKLEKLSKNSCPGDEDDDVFKNNTGSRQPDPGVPDTTKDKEKARIHSNPGSVGAQTKSTGTGNPSNNVLGAGSGNRTGPGSGSGAGTENQRVKNFPPAYYNVRKLRANSQPVSELNSITGDRRGGGLVRLTTDRLRDLK
jgi:hypothetical protein